MFVEGLGGCRAVGGQVGDAFAFGLGGLCLDQSAGQSLHRRTVNQVVITAGFGDGLDVRRAEGEVEAAVGAGIDTALQCEVVGQRADRAQESGITVFAIGQRLRADRFDHFRRQVLVDAPDQGSDKSALGGLVDDLSDHDTLVIVGYGAAQLFDRDGFLRCSHPRVVVNPDQLFGFGGVGPAVNHIGVFTFIHVEVNDVVGRNEAAFRVCRADNRQHVLRNGAARDIQLAGFTSGLEIFDAAGVVLFHNVIPATAQDVTAAQEVSGDTGQDQSDTGPDQTADAG